MRARLLTLCSLTVLGTGLSAACSTTYVAATVTTNQARSDSQSTMADSGAIHAPDGALAVNPCRDTNVLTDPKNCGTCGTVCGKAANSVGVDCVAGTCKPTCTDGFHVNPANNQCEPNAACSGYDTTNDSNNCGACGVQCVLPANASNVKCVSSRCAPTCNSGYAPSGTVCVCNNTTSDSNNCGSCGHVCSKPANADSVSCSAGACVPQCASGYLRSGTTCILKTGPCDGLDLQADTENCGTCGNTCFDSNHPASSQDPARQGGSVTCNAGRCEMYCPAGYSSTSFREGCNCSNAATGAQSLYPMCT